MLLVNGSMHSLLPRIWLVLAVGMGAIMSELRTPYLMTSARSDSQSRPRAGLGCLMLTHTHTHVSQISYVLCNACDKKPTFWFHMSNWKMPWLMGEPGKVSYGPSFLANSIEAVHDAK